MWAEGVFPPHATAAAAAAAAAPVVPPPPSPTATPDATTSPADAPAPATATTIAAAAATGGLPLLVPHPDTTTAPAAGAPQATIVTPPLAPLGVAQGGVHGGSGARGPGSQQGQQGPEASWPLIVLHFSVRDTGIGIAPEDLGRLFNSFTQVGGLMSRIALSRCIRKRALLLHQKVLTISVVPASALLNGASPAHSSLVKWTYV